MLKSLFLLVSKPIVARTYLFCRTFEIYTICARTHRSKLKQLQNVLTF